MAANKGQTVSVRLHSITKAAMELIASEERMKSGRRLTNDGVIWALIRDCKPEILSRVEKTIGGKVPSELEFDRRYEKQGKKKKPE